MNTNNIKREKLSFEELREGFLGILRVNLRKREDDGTATRECVMFPDLEEYLCCVDADLTGKYISARVTPEHLQALHIDIDEAWEVAAKNTGDSATVDEIGAKINSLVEEIYGAPLIDMSEIMRDSFSLYVISNREACAGSGSILYCRKQMEDLSERLGFRRWIAYPSSAHEWILEPDEGCGTLEDRLRLMKEIDEENGQDNRLIDKVYYLTF